MPHLTPQQLQLYRAIHAECRANNGKTRNLARIAGKLDQYYNRAHERLTRFSELGLFKVTSRGAGRQLEIEL
jgi:hypothetical protein